MSTASWNPFANDPVVNPERPFTRRSDIDARVFRSNHVVVLRHRAMTSQGMRFILRT